MHFVGAFLHERLSHIKSLIVDLKTGDEDLAAVVAGHLYHSYTF